MRLRALRVAISTPGGPDSGRDDAGECLAAMRRNQSSPGICGPIEQARNGGEASQRRAFPRRSGGTSHVNIQARLTPAEERSAVHFRRRRGGGLRPYRPTRPPFPAPPEPLHKNLTTENCGPPGGRPGPKVPELRRGNCPVARTRVLRVRRVVDANSRHRGKAAVRASLRGNFSGPPPGFSCGFGPFA